MSHRYHHQFGWTNNETWVTYNNLYRHFDPAEHFPGCPTNKDDLAFCLEVYAKRVVLGDFDIEKPDWPQIFLRAFFSYVNWEEIAEDMLANHISEES